MRTILSVVSLRILVRNLRHALSISARLSQSPSPRRSPRQNGHLSTQRRVDQPPPIIRIIPIGISALSARQIVGHVEQIGVIAELAKEGDGLEGLRAFAFEQGFRLGGVHEVLVEGELEGRKGAEDDVLVFDGDCGWRKRFSSALGREMEERRGRLTVLGEQVVGTTDDELVDLGTQLLERLVSLGLLRVGRIAVATAKDGQLELLVEVLLGAEVARIAEGEERVVLVEVVLCGGSAVSERREGRAATSDDEPGWACR